MTAQDTEAPLVARAADGDHMAVAELYRRHAGAALRAARAVTGNSHDAEDAMSEAFMRVLQALGTQRLAPDVRFRAYLLTSSRHAAVDVVRRSARCQPTELADQLDGPADGPQPGDRLVAEVDAELVGRVFRQLPPTWQMVLVLVDVDGMALKEAAVRLGLSPNGAAQLAVRARAGLRSRFLLASGVPDAQGRAAGRDPVNSRYRMAAIPTIGLLSGVAPVEPLNEASPKEKIPPSEATSQ